MYGDFQWAVTVISDRVKLWLQIRRAVAAELEAEIHSVTSESFYTSESEFDELDEWAEEDEVYAALTIQAQVCQVYSITIQTQYIYCTFAYNSTHYPSTGPWLDAEQASGLGDSRQGTTLAGAAAARGGCLRRHADAQL